MRITINRDAALTALSRMQSVVERRNVIQVLANVLLEVGDDHLSLTATDLEIQMSDTVPCRVERGGRTTVSAVLLHDIFRNLPAGGEVLLEITDTDPRLKLKCGGSKMQIATLPADDFTKFGSLDCGQAFTIAGAGLKRLLETAAPAMADPKARAYLASVYLHQVEVGGVSLLRAVASNDKRLALAEVVAPPELPEGGTLLPAKLVRTMIRLLGEASEDVQVSFNDARASLTIGTCVVVGKVIEGKYPDYPRVIARCDGAAVARVARPIIEAAIRRTLLLSTRQTEVIKVNFTKDQMVLTLWTASTGQASELLPIEYDGDDLEIGFVGPYLLDVIGQVSGQTAALHLPGPKMPMFVRDSGDQDVIFLISPAMAGS